jgi:hypothetical protein
LAQLAVEVVVVDDLIDKTDRHGTFRP